MKIAIFDAKSYDETYFKQENKGRHQLTFFPESLTMATVAKAKGFDAVCEFVNTKATPELLNKLAAMNIKVWLQRSMGYNSVDLAAAEKAGVHVFRLPNYSAETVSEHALSLLLALNRKLIPAHARTSHYNFALAGLEGKTIINSHVGVIGSGKIGQGFIKALVGMGAEVSVFDEWAEKNTPQIAEQLHFKFVTLDTLLKTSDFISLHAPLLPTTRHMINAAAIKKMKPGVIIINTARGPLIDTTALLAGLKSGRIGGAGLDVLEREEGRFFFDLSAHGDEIAKADPEWAALLQMDNVIITAHQAFLTTTALTQIAAITLANADEAAQGKWDKALQLMPDGTVRNG